MDSIISFCCILLGLVFQCRGITVDDCPHNLIRDAYLKAHGQKCYRFDLHRKFYWADAEKECQILGGHLVEIDELDEVYFLMSSLRSLRYNGDQLWIGLSDTAKEGTFVWTSGNPAYFSFWAPGEPSKDGLAGLTHDVEDCVLMSFLDSGHWFDHFCNFAFEWYPFICQFEPISHASTTAAGITQASTNAH